MSTPLAREEIPPAPRPDWFSTRGRRGRLSFLLNFLFVNITVGVISAIAASGEGLAIPLIDVACSIAGGWVNICLTAQRLHDMDRSGWLQIVPFLAALLGVALIVLGHPLAGALGTAMLLAGCLGFLVWLLLGKGTPGDNTYGSPHRPNAAR